MPSELDLVIGRQRSFIIKGWEESMHPRGFHGKWIAAIGKLQEKHKGEMVHRPGWGDDPTVQRENLSNAKAIMREHPHNSKVAAGYLRSAGYPEHAHALEHGKEPPHPNHLRSDVDRTPEGHLPTTSTGVPDLSTLVPRGKPMSEMTSDEKLHALANIADRNLARRGVRPGGKSHIPGIRRETTAERDRRRRQPTGSAAGKRPTPTASRTAPKRQPTGSRAPRMPAVSRMELKDAEEASRKANAALDKEAAKMGTGKYDGARASRLQDKRDKADARLKELRSRATS